MAQNKRRWAGVPNLKLLNGKRKKVNFAKRYNNTDLREIN